MVLALALFLAVEIPPASPEAPNRQPQLAAAGKTVAVTYGAGNTIYFAASKDGGKSFGAPATVSSSGKLSLGMHRGPRIALAPKAIVISAIVGEQGGGKDGDLLVWRSTDDGKSWPGPVRVNDVAGSAREGLHAMAFGGTDTLYAAWLDLRSEGTRIYGSVSHDAGATWSKNRLVYESPSGSVCQCCHPSVAVDAAGTITVMFRNSLDGARDMYTTRSTDGGATFNPASKVGIGTWKLEACPMDGGGLAVDAQGAPGTIWRRDQSLFVAMGTAPEKALGFGKNPAAASGRRDFYAVWTSDKSVLFWRASGEQPETLSEDGAFPSIATLPNGKVAVAWEAPGGIRIEILKERADRFQFQ
jgi:hypothetical protein